MVGRIYKDDHYTLLHTKYESSWPCGFGEEDFFYVFPITPPGRVLYGPVWISLKEGSADLNTGMIHQENMSVH